jgi:hypothetical protein
MPRFAATLLTAGGLVLVVAAPAVAGTSVVPTVKSATAPKTINEGSPSGLTQANVVLATKGSAPAKAATIIVSLQKGATSLGTVGRKKMRASTGYKSRLVKVDIEIPVETPRGPYRLRICVLKSCRAVPFTRLALPRGYEGDVRAVDATSRPADGSTSRQEFKGVVKFERIKPYSPGRGEYEVVGGGGQVTLDRTDPNCTTSGSAPVPFPIRDASAATLRVIDVRTTNITQGDGTPLVFDPNLPFYFHIKLEPGTQDLGAARRTCTDGRVQDLGIPRMTFLRAGNNMVYNTSGGDEPAVRRAPTPDVLQGSLTEASVISTGGITWEWNLKAFD